jgi:hypothetical protein
MKNGPRLWYVEAGGGALEQSARSSGFRRTKCSTRSAGDGSTPPPPPHHPPHPHPTRCAFLCVWVVGVALVPLPAVNKRPGAHAPGVRLSDGTD